VFACFTRGTIPAKLFRQPNSRREVLAILIEIESFFEVVKQFLIVIAFLTAFSVCAANLDTDGVTLLRQVDPALNGSGVRVAQVEGTESATDPNQFEVIPFSIGQPTNLFSYTNSSGTGANGYPNTVGTGSSHATSVGGNFYGIGGVATNVSHVDNYNANYFLNSIIQFGRNVPDEIVNQSFNLADSALDSLYDDDAASRKILFITGAGNNGSISTNQPATCFNGIAVGVTDGTSAVGPTSDGRCKPDITCPGFGVTSFSTPYVSGAATILLQAAARGDGGASSSSATNPIVIKALLLNGAIKTTDWTNSPNSPLDMRYGAGVLNVFNSWNQLKGAQHSPIETTIVNPSGSPHPPGSNPANEASLIGWDYNTALSTTSSQDEIAHYYFNLTGSNFYTFTATLVWNKQLNKSGINNLDFYLFNTANGNLILSSTSAVDNVEHLFLPQLASGRYDLQVLKRGSGQAASSETYALAFEFFCMKLKIVSSNRNAILSWTNAPTGFHLAATTNLAPPSAWTTNLNFISVAMSNNQNIVTLPIAATNQFFRLQRP
jgi:hypothetical protein